MTYTSQPGGASGSVAQTIGQTVKLEQEALDAAERVAREAKEAKEVKDKKLDAAVRADREAREAWEGKEKKAAEANERLDGTRGIVARAPRVDERVERG